MVEAFGHIEHTRAFTGKFCLLEKASKYLRLSRVDLCPYERTTMKKVIVAATFVAIGMSACTSPSKVTLESAKANRKIASDNTNLDAGQAIQLIRKTYAGKRIVTYIGYSAQGYDESVHVEELIRKSLSRFNPNRVVINSGLTTVGIGAVYEIAKQMGFETIAVVSMESLGQYRDEAGEAKGLSNVYRIADGTWGGLNKVTNELNPTSKVNAEVSDEMVAIGGGDIGYFEARAGIERRIPVALYSARNGVKDATKSPDGYRKPGKEAVQDLVKQYPNLVMN